MEFSKRTQYGLRAMAYLANSFGKKESIHSLKEISKKEKISFDYLEKILSKLEKKGLVGSKRGVRGGYFLNRRPNKIKIIEIIKVLEGTMAPVKCVAREKSKRYKCPQRRVCKTFNVWQKVQEVLYSTLNSITLADLVNPPKKQGFKQGKK